MKEIFSSLYLSNSRNYVYIIFLQNSKLKEHKTKVDQNLLGPYCSFFWNSMNGIFCMNVSRDYFAPY